MTGFLIFTLKDKLDFYTYHIIFNQYPNRSILINLTSSNPTRFNYDPSFAEHSGLLGYDPTAPTPQLDTGVIAQEVRRVLPEAVKEAGDVTLPNGDTIPKFLVVNKVGLFDILKF